MTQRPPKDRHSRRAALPKLLAVLAALAGAAALVGPRNIWEKTVGGDAGPVDFAAPGFATVLGNKPNIGLAAPSDFYTGELANRVSHTVPDFEAAADDLFSTIKTAALELPNTRLADQDFASRTLRFVRYSPGLGFPDTVNIQLVERPEGKTSFLALAQARIGYSDLGMNAKLLGQLIDAVAGRLPTHTTEG